METVQYVGPYTSSAYDAANQIINGGSGVPFNSDTIAEAQQIIAAQPKTTTTTTPAPTTATTAPLNQAAVDNTQKTIDQIGPLLQAALAAETTTHQNALNAFNQEQQQQQGTYDKSTTTNQQNYDSNFMDSIRAGIHGLGGLMALLRGTGAAGGTAENQARDIVGGTTSNDIRGGADTQKANQSSLDSSLSAFLTDLQGKRQTAEDTFTNNQRAIRRGSDTQLQDLYSKMAGYYGDAGNTDLANQFMAKAGALTPEIADNNKAQVSLYDTTPVAVQAPKLTAFSGPTQPNVLAAPENGQVGTGIFTMSDPRRKDQTQVPALAGA